MFILHIGKLRYAIYMLMAESQVVNKDELLLYIWVNGNNGARSLKSDTYSEFPPLSNLEGGKKGISQKFCWYTKMSSQQTASAFEHE